MRVLAHIYDNDQGRFHEPASLGALYEVFGEDAALGSAVSLKQRGLIESEMRLSGGYHITADGRSAVEAVRARQGDRAHRRAEARNMLLRWLDSRDANDTGSRVARSDFDARLDLVPFTDTESEMAAEHLKKHGLVGSISSGQADHILLWLTETGRECIDSGLPVDVFVARYERTTGHHQTIHVSGNNNAIAGAVGTNASAGATVDVASAHLLAQAIRQIGAALNLPGEADEVLTEIERSNDPSVLKRAIGRLYLLVNDTTTGAAGGIVAAYMVAQFGIASGS